MSRMKIMTDIRNIYFPVQPTIKKSVDHVSYTECRPNVILQPYIYCYWQVKSSQPLESNFKYQVVADGCIDIFFELSYPNESYVMGFCDTNTQFLLGDSFNYVGIRFLPTIFPQLFNVGASALSNTVEQLDAVAPQLRSFINQRFNVEQRLTEIGVFFDNYFLRLVSKTAFKNDNRLYEAIDIILKKCRLYWYQH